MVETGIIGLILASIILVIFLRDWGTSLVAGLMIPATIALTFIALKLMGESFNLMTLGGLAAAVGLVIDTAIVVVENIVLHRDAGQTRLQAIHSALGEITIPLVGSTITPIVVFLPLVSITGVTGTFFRALAVTMSVALLASLALALTWTPALSQFLIKRSTGDPSGIADGQEDTLDQIAPEPEVESIRRLMEAEEASLSGFFRKVINGGQFFGRDESGGAPPRTNPARDARGREHLAAHGPATGTGGGDRGEHGRHLGEVEAVSQPGYRQCHRRRSRENQDGRTGH